MTLTEPSTKALREEQAALQDAIALAEEERQKLEAEAEEARRAYADSCAAARMGEIPGRAAATASTLKKKREAAEEIGLTLVGLQTRLAAVTAQTEAAERAEAVATIERVRAAVAQQVQEAWALIAQAEALLFQANQDGDGVHGLARRYGVAEVRALGLWEAGREPYLLGLGREPVLVVRVR